MSSLTARFWLATTVLGLLTLHLGVGSGAAVEALPDRADEETELTAWAAGPVRWLLMPAEQRRLREISESGAAVGFIERFWAQRDPDPAVPGNPFREMFYKRVEAADLLYVDEGRRGSLTDRGRALILLGSPTRLRVTSQEALSWDPSSGASDNVRVRYLPLEIWTYRLEDLERPLRLALMALGDDTEFRISFVKDVDRTSLNEGQPLLELAARTALALDAGR